MRALGIALGGLAVVAAVAVGWAMKGDRPSDVAEAAPAEPQAVRAEYVELEEPLLFGEDEPEIPEPFKKERRTTPPELHELSYDKPIRVWHPDNSITVYKLARVKYADGTMEEIPVKIHGRLADKPMQIRSARDKIEAKRKWREAREAGRPVPSFKELFGGGEDASEDGADGGGDDPGSSG